MINHLSSIIVPRMQLSDVFVGQGIQVKGSRCSPLEGVVGCARDGYKEFKSRQQTLSTGGRGRLCTRRLQGVLVEAADALHWRAWSAVHETATRSSSKRQQTLSTGGRGRLCTRRLQRIQVKAADALHWRVWSAVHATTTRNSSRGSRRSPLEGVDGCARDDYKEFKSRQQTLSTGGCGRLCSRLLHVQGIRADKKRLS